MNLQEASPVVLSWLVNLLLAFVALAAPTVAVGVVRLLIAKEAEIKSKATANNQATYQVFDALLAAASLAVKGAEQYFGSGQGKEKKAMAVATVQNLLASHGITSVDVAATEAAVEAAVFTDIHDSKPQPGVRGPAADAASAPAPIPVTA